VGTGLGTVVKLSRRRRSRGEGRGGEGRRIAAAAARAGTTATTTRANSGGSSPLAGLGRVRQKNIWADMYRPKYPRIPIIQPYSDTYRPAYLTRIRIRIRAAEVENRKLECRAPERGRGGESRGGGGTPAAPSQPRVPSRHLGEVWSKG
jgi:hypothetical protein